MIEEEKRHLLLLNKLSEQSRKLGQAYYLLEIVAEEKAIKKSTKDRIDKFILDAKKVKKIRISSYSSLSDHLIKIVFRYYNIPMMARYIKSRERKYVKTRQVAMFLLHEQFKGKISLVEIGDMFHKDHATVLHSVRKQIKYMTNENRKESMGA